LIVVRIQIIIRERESNVQQDFSEIDTLRWPAMPNPKDESSFGQLGWIWPTSRLKGIEQTNPHNAHDSGYLVFPFALALFDQRKCHILSVALQQTDYRVLAELTNTSVKELSGDKRKILSELHLVVWDAEKHLDLGPYEGVLAATEVFNLLVEVAADVLDLWDDPIRRSV